MCIPIDPMHLRNFTVFVHRELVHAAGRRMPLVTFFFSRAEFRRACESTSLIVADISTTPKSAHLSHAVSDDQAATNTTVVNVGLGLSFSHVTSGLPFDFGLQSGLLQVTQAVNVERRLEERRRRDQLWVKPRRRTKRKARAAAAAAAEHRHQHSVRGSVEGIRHNRRHEKQSGRSSGGGSGGSGSEFALHAALMSPHHAAGPQSSHNVSTRGGSALNGSRSARGTDGFSGFGRREQIRFAQGSRVAARVASRSGTAPWPGAAGARAGTQVEALPPPGVQSGNGGDDFTLNFPKVCRCC